MSIWSSVGNGPCLASDFDDSATNQYAGTGEDNYEIDVATTGLHDGVRLAVLPAVNHEGDLDVDLLLSRDSAALLRDKLDAALRRDTP